MNDDTFLMGMVFVTEDPRVFQQAKAIDMEVADEEGVQILSHKAVMVDVDESWDLRHESALSDVMQLVVKAHRAHASSIYIIYEGDPEELKKTRVPMVIG